MSEFNQLPMISELPIQDKEEPKCACLLLLDVSLSMNGPPIDELNRGIRIFTGKLQEDSLVCKRVEVGIVTFGPVKTHAPFIGARDFRPPTLTTQGDTPMGAAIEHAADLIASRKEAYKKDHIQYYKPMIFLITDGGPTDKSDVWEAAVRRVTKDEADGRYRFFAIGVEGANFDFLRQLGPRDPLKLKGLKFDELFAWVARSLSQTSRSSPDDTITFENPTGPKGWGEQA